MSFEDRVREVVDPELRDIRQMFQHSEPTSTSPLTDQQLDTLLNKNLQRESKNELNWLEDANPVAKHPDQEDEEDPEREGADPEEVRSIVKTLKDSIENPYADSTSKNLWDLLSDLEDSTYHDNSANEGRGVLGLGWDLWNDAKAFAKGGPMGLLFHIIARETRRKGMDLIIKALPTLITVASINKSIQESHNATQESLENIINKLINDPTDGFQRSRQQLRDFIQYFNEKILKDPTGEGNSLSEMMQKCCSENKNCCEEVKQSIKDIGKPSSLQNLELISKMDEVLADTSVIRGLL